MVLEAVSFAFPDILILFVGFSKKRKRRKDVLILAEVDNQRPD